MSDFLKLFPSRVFAEVLQLFLFNHEEEFYQSYIAKRLGCALMQVQRALIRLEKTGLITHQRRGRMLFYKANCTHPGFEELKKLFLKTIGLGDNVRELLNPLREKIEFAFIYGSYARGEEGTESDIDLFLIADIGIRELSKSLAPLTRTLSKELNPTVFSKKEFLEKSKGKDHFINDVIVSPKIWIIGNNNEFKRLVNRR